MMSFLDAGVGLVLNKRQIVVCERHVAQCGGLCMYQSYPAAWVILRSRMQHGYGYYWSLHCTEVCKLQTRAAESWLVVPHMHCSWCGDSLCCSSLVVLAPPPDAGSGRVQ
jgi:hypothetical protein